MSGLAIKPHSRRISGMAVAGLALVSVGSFAAGLAHQITIRSGSAPFPAAQATVQTYAAIPDARPAPDMQLAATEPAPRRKALAAPAPAAAEAPPSPAADTGPVVDAAATAPEAAPAVAEPPPTF